MPDVQRQLMIDAVAKLSRRARDAENRGDGKEAERLLRRIERVVTFHD